MPAVGVGDNMGITGLGPGAGGQVGLGLRTGPGRDLAGTAERWACPGGGRVGQGCERAGWASWRRRCWESVICRWKLGVCEPRGQGACALCPVSLPEGRGREDRGSERGVTTSPESRSGAPPGQSAGLPREQPSGSRPGHRVHTAAPRTSRVLAVPWPRPQWASGGLLSQAWGPGRWRFCCQAQPRGLRLG